MVPYATEVMLLDWLRQFRKQLPLHEFEAVQDFLCGERDILVSNYFYLAPITHLSLTMTFSQAYHLYKDIYTNN